MQTYGELVAAAPGTAVVSTDAEVAGTTLTDIDDLAMYVQAGRTYIFRAVIFWTADASAGIKFAMDGTATASAIIYQMKALNDATGSNSILSSAQKTALGGSAGQTGATTGLCEIVGSITVSASGTLVPQIAEVS